MVEHISVSLFGNITTTDGVQKVMPFDAFGKMLTKFYTRNKKDGQLYSPAIYKGDCKRSNANVWGHSFACLDFDNAGDTNTVIDDVLPKLKELAYIYHTTHSHSPDKAKWRLIIPYSEEIPADYCDQAWSQVYEYLEAFGVDISSKDVSRAFYLPSSPKEFEIIRACGYSNGNAFVVDKSKAIVGVPWEQPKEGRNNRLKSIVSAMLANSSTFEETVSEILKADALNEQPLFSDPTEAQYIGIPPEIAARQFVSNIAASHNRNRQAKGLPLESFREIISVESEIETMETMPEYKIPDFVHSASGTIRDIYEYMEKRAIKPQPLLSITAAIALLATVMGRKVATETNLRTNILLCGIGATSSGKDNARRCIKDILIKAEMTEYIGCEDIASDSALYKAVVAQPAMLALIDEFGHFLRNVTNHNASSHLSGLARLIMRFDSQANELMLGKEYAANDRKRIDIHQPNFCMYSTTVPEKLMAVLSDNEIDDGFVPRLLCTEAQAFVLPRYQVDMVDVPYSVISEIQYWHNLSLNNRPNAGNLEQVIIPNPRIIPMTKQARDLAYEISCEASKQIDNGALWGKVQSHIGRISLVHAGSLHNCELVEIDIESVEWAYQFVKHSIDTIITLKDRFMSVNIDEKQKQRIMRIIDTTGITGITRRDLLRKCAWLKDTKHLDIVMQFLHEAGQIQVKEEKKLNGKTAHRYFSARFIRSIETD